MKPTIIGLAFLVSIACRSNADLFSSSTNLIQTLTVASNEVISISGILYSPSVSGARCNATIQQNSNVYLAPLALTNPDALPNSNPRLRILAGPMQIQFQANNVHLAFQRIQITNTFTIHVEGTNVLIINVPAGKTINFISPVSWRGDFGLLPGVAGASISNSAVVVQNLIYDGDSFTGPLTITICTCTPSGVVGFSHSLVTYYFTEEFATIPDIGVIQVPAGKSQIQVEKSDDMQHWRTIFFNEVPRDTHGFYRLKTTKQY